MDRLGTMRTRRSRRGDAVMAYISMAHEPVRVSSSRRVPRFLHCALITMAALIACAVTLAVFAASGRYGDLLPHLSDALISVSSIYTGESARPHWHVASHPGRLLEADTSHEDSLPPISYGAQLELFMCSPRPLTEDNDAREVEIPELTKALSRIDELGQSETEEIVVTMRIGPEGEDDETYKCDESGMLQWRAQISYSPDDEGASPAISAACANDYIAHSPMDFKSTLTSNVNEEHADEALNLTASDVEVVTLGWFIVLPEEVTFEDSENVHLLDWLAPAIRGDFWLWKWWVWVLYGVLLACCCLPLFLCMRIRGSETPETASSLKGVKNEKTCGPEWGSLEPDYAPEYKCYSTPPELTVEYSNPVKSIQPISQPSSRSFNTSLSRKTQEAGKKSVWTLPSPSGSPLQDLSVHRVQPVEQDDDTDTNVSRMRNTNPDFNFDKAIPGAGGGTPCYSESKTPP